MKNEKYSWKILRDQTPSDRIQILSSIKDRNIPDLLVFKPRFKRERDNTKLSTNLKGDDKRLGEYLNYLRND